MSKELTIYPKLPRTPGPGTGWADLRRDQDRECRLAHEKRFTDAELAAEVHAARKAVIRERYTLHKFATSPHYYESEIEAAA